MATLKNLITILLLGGLLYPVSAQKDTLVFKSPPENEALQIALQQVLQANKDSVPAFQVENQLKSTLQERGYWLYDISYQPQRNEYQLETGPQISHFDVEVSIQDSNVRPAALYDMKGEILSSELLKKQSDYYLGFYENNGFPFASLYWENYQINNDTLAGNLVVRTGPYLTFDSLSIKGYTTFSPNVLRYDLGYFKGRQYSEAFIFQLEEKIQQIEYLSFSRPPAVAFFKDKTTLFLYLQEQKGNQIDGVVGLNTETDGETTLNGDFKLRLLNTFKSGEEINLRWRRPDESVQQLQLGFNWPYLFRTPFWLSADLEIFRQDSSFVNTDLNGLVKYLIATRSFVSGGFSYRASNVLLSEEDQPQSPLTSLNTFRTYQYLLGTELYRTNRALVPIKGYLLKLYGITGNRVTDASRQEQYGWRAEAEHYWNFFSNMILKSTLNTRALIGENLFENELYRIGGLKSLRGINEQSIFSSAYGIASLEYRYMIGNYDYLALFGDVAYTEKSAGNTFSSDWLTGLGAGINFRTNGGIFSLFLAVGKTQSTSFDFRATKVHFGYINRF